MTEKTKVTIEIDWDKPNDPFWELGITKPAFAISNKVFFKVGERAVKRELVNGKFIYSEIFQDGSSKRIQKKTVEKLLGANKS